MNADCDSAKSDNSAGQLGVMSGARRNAPFFQRSDWLSFGATTLLALLVYLFTLGPRCGVGQFRSLVHCGCVRRRVVSTGISVLDLVGMGVHQIAAVFKHCLARGRFLGRGGRPGLRLDCLDGVAGRRGHFGPDARPSKIKAKGREMAPRDLRLRGGNGFWIEWRFLAAGGHCCGLAVEHIIALPCPVSASALEFPAGKQTLPLYRRPDLWVVVDKQPD